MSFDCRAGRLALIGVLAATLALAACGRKGDLEPPPAAAAPPATGNQPAAPSQGGKGFILDGILN